MKPLVLIVDDTPANLNLLANLLKTTYDIRVANNGLKALELAQIEPLPDAILLDVMMPEMDGWTVCEKLKSIEATVHIPVLFLTAKNSIQDEEYGLNLGAVDFISKPISPPIVLARLRTHLQNREYQKFLEYKAEEERKTLQAQLQQAQKMEAIGTFSGGIAHDFNNILSAILGYAEMIQEDLPAGSMLANDIDQVIKASHRAKELVKQILAFSRQAETERIPLEPSLIIKEVSKMLRSSLPATIKIQLDLDQDKDLIMADPTQIHQILMNLCTNAYHAMEETGGTLSISLKKENPIRDDLVNEPNLQSGEFVRLSIADTGSGIEPEIRERIFEPYFTTKETGKGTGMGLSIINDIVKSYGGLVSCHSQPGEGTVFDVYLPVITDTILSENTQEDHIQFGDERILFVDDEKIIADMSKSMLERLGYRVTTMTNSVEALTTFQNQSEEFDLVITDQTMSDMTGCDLARRMLQIRPGMPIILCTGFNSLISEEKARSYGIKAFAMKPLARKDIAALVRQVLDHDNLL